MKILVVSNMYPNKSHPAHGTFIKKFCDQLEVLDIDYKKCVMYQANTKIGKLFNYMIFYSRSFFLCLTGNYDLIYVQYASYSSPGVLLASKFRNLKIYTNVHGSDVIPENKKQEKMHKNTVAILKISDRIISPSMYFKNLVADKYQINKDKIFVYPSGGVDMKLFHPLNDDERTTVLKKYGLDPNKPTFGFVGRISVGKGWDTFVKAVAESIRNGIHANFILVGNGPQDEKLNEILVMEGMKNYIKRVQLLPQEELSKIYGAISFLCSSSRLGESLCLVVLEGMACGTPVISSDYAAPKYYIEDGVNGYKFEVGNWHELANTMIQCSQMDNRSYKKMCEASITTAENYSTEKIVPLLKDILFN